MYFIFFFKQKTAYDMRISDWSSDVCSSDLGPACFGRQARPVTRNGKAARGVVGALGRDRDEGRPIFLVASLHEQIVRDPPGRAGGQVDHIVGRAALRVVETVVLEDRKSTRLNSSH